VLHDGFAVTDVFVQLVSGQRSVTFDDSCSDTSVMSLQFPPPAAAAGDESLLVILLRLLLKPGFHYPS